MAGDGMATATADRVGRGRSWIVLILKSAAPRYSSRCLQAARRIPAAHGQQSRAAAHPVFGTECSRVWVRVRAPVPDDQRPRSHIRSRQPHQRECDVRGQLTGVGTNAGLEVRDWLRRIPAEVVQRHAGESDHQRARAAVPCRSADTALRPTASRSVFSRPSRSSTARSREASSGFSTIADWVEAFKAKRAQIVERRCA